MLFDALLITNAMCGGDCGGDVGDGGGGWCSGCGVALLCGGAALLCVRASPSMALYAVLYDQKHHAGRAKAPWLPHTHRVSAPANSR